MSLTNPEQRQLDQIERMLITEAPRLAELLAPAAVRRQVRSRRIWRWTGALAAIVGVALLFAGARANLTAIAVAGAVLAVLAALAAYVGPVLQQRLRWRR